ncbi:CocE/NonD family hydrolase [Roseovarius aestuarii]|nr:CocE/NonD family hydrolase [Roseovarius aestuarii]
MTTIKTKFPFQVETIENIFVPLPDGTQLAARIWRPVTDTPLPAILEYLPYRKRDGTRGRDDQTLGYLAGHGYVAIRLDIRGTGDSDGILTDEYTVQEQLDGIDAINWIAQQAWCDGQIAMMGISWGGFNGLQIAARQPACLKTVITVGSSDDRYATDVHWIGGCLSKDNFDWSSTMLAYNDLPPDPEIVGDRWRDMWQQRMTANKPWIIEWLHHQRRDDYWQQGSVDTDFSALQIPIYAVSGWADNYSESIPRLLAGLSCPCRGLIGPWAHSYPHSVAVGPAIGWLQEVLRWLDHWLKGHDTGIMDEPKLRAWMQESVPPKTCYTSRPGRWVGEADWPSPRIEPRDFWLGGAGTLAPTRQPPATRSVCSPLWVGLAAGEVGRYGNEADWPTDQREDDGGSLTFNSAILPEPIEILGAPVLRLRIAADKPQALVAVRLNDISPSGATTRVCLGILNLTHRDSHAQPRALNPGEFYDVEVELDDIAHAFPAGHKIGLSLSSTYYPIAWPSPELATLSIQVDHSALCLPVRPPNPDDAELRAFDRPEQAPAAPVITHPVTTGPSTRQVTRDLLSDTYTVTFPRGDSVVEMTDINQTHVTTAHVRHDIAGDDPLSAKTHTDFRTEIRRQDAVFVHHSTGTLSCDAEHFIVDMQLRVTEDGREVFENQWHERIRRDHV